MFRKLMNYYWTGKMFSAFVGICLLGGFELGKVTYQYLNPEPTPPSVTQVK